MNDCTPSATISASTADPEGIFPRMAHITLRTGWRDDIRDVATDTVVRIVR